MAGNFLGGNFLGGYQHFHMDPKDKVLSSLFDVLPRCHLMISEKNDVYKFIYPNRLAEPMFNRILAWDL